MLIHYMAMPIHQRSGPKPPTAGAAGAAGGKTRESMVEV